MAMFDLTEQGIVEVGKEAKIFGDIQGVEAVEYHPNVEDYMQQIAANAGLLALNETTAA